ncbi:hypothetical protein [Alicyclobacillus sp. ALC3]|uniref:hypothetical protein n=1 Tax=Alicyclobacillus sp. ALC3 TaxID=2796143 RepID=UPI002378A742|nr:hypothetical protein [Alicyclobacillus sp. ALC3]
MTMTQWLAFILGGVAIVLLCGYAMGRRVGYRQGMRKAKAKVPLELRACAHELGHCPICDTMWHEGVSG